MTNLETDLQSIDGVGPKTTERIMEVIDAHASGGENVREALDYLEAGRPGYAAKYLRRAVGEQ